jgi:hypothetical protein
VVVGIEPEGKCTWLLLRVSHVATTFISSDMNKLARVEPDLPANAVIV